MSRIRILLADDHALVRAGLRSLIEQVDGVEVIAEASNGREAVELVRLRRPDVVMMDIGMPELNGLTATERIARRFPGTRVLLLSMYSSEHYVSEAITAGAAGYIVKDAGVAEMSLAIQAVSRGDSYFSPQVAKHLITGKGVNRVHSGATGWRRLTVRQREILQLIAEGHSTKQIASTLDLSYKTVDTHRTKLMERLDIHGIAGLVRYAIRMGLSTSDS